MLPESHKMDSYLVSLLAFNIGLQNFGHCEESDSDEWARMITVPFDICYRINA